MDLERLEATAARELRGHGLHDWTFGPPETVLDTLRHEIAHAIAGPAARHGPAWKAVAIRLGATPRACETSPQAVVKPGDWQVTCPACERTVHLYRRPRSLGGYRCKCEARSPLTFEYTGDPARRPAVPLTAQESANWEATCAGCGAVHLRVRRPKSGVWRCKCPHRSELAWRPRSR
jgi:predicted SprT family Zn-dependent metalloprotease